MNGESKRLGILGFIFLIVLGAACSPSRPEQGCQGFAELVDAIALRVESGHGAPKIDSVVTKLEANAMILFHDDDEMSRAAYRLWKSAAIVDYSGKWTTANSDIVLYAEDLIELCATRGYTVPKVDPQVIEEYISTPAYKR